MLKKLFKNIKWGYALGEITLIFIGITTAISFNNWNESRKARNTEIKSLKEVRVAIKEDMIDINGNIQSFSNRVKVYNLILEHQEKKLPYNDSLKKYLPYLQGFTTFISNVGPYETLKSKGLASVSNDSVRLKIASYYDVNYEIIHTNEKEHHDHYSDYIKPQLLKKFNLSNYFLEPLNYNKLLNDFEFKQIIYWAKRTDSFMLEVYKDVQQKGMELISDLDKEIKSLED